MAANPLVSICIPHWQVRDMMAVCLRAIRRHSREYNYEVLVVDNGSKDESLDWLRSLGWIRLIERPEESQSNWPANVFTAWDLGLKRANGRYFLTMHSDVFVRSDRWLDPMLALMEQSAHIAATGAWKQCVENPLYAWQKRLLGGTLAACKRLLGRHARGSFRQGHYPRDYCALYRREVLLRHQLTFCPADELITGGYSIALQLWKLGYQTPTIPLWLISRNMVHLAHGTAALSATGKPLRHTAGQRKAQKRAAAICNEPWVRALRDAAELDAA